jgi:hypothetical protein
MAQQNRVTIQGLINLYITSNGNKEITGAQLKEILTNLNDSAFLQLDELRTALSTSYNPANPLDWNTVPAEVKAALDEAISRVEGLENAPNQTAIQTPYTPTTQSDWDAVPPAPTELQSSTDELAQRLRTVEDSLSTNPSQDIAFVSNDGNDTTAERGNPLKPFATIQTAINAVSNNGIVKVLGGTYSYSSSVSVNRLNFILDISSCNITFTGASASLVIQGSNVVLIAYGANVESQATSSGTLAIINSNNAKVIGGNFIGNGTRALRVFNTGLNTEITYSSFESNITCVDASADTNFLKCKINTSSTTIRAALFGGIAKLNDTEITGGKNGVEILPNSTLKMKDCEVDSVDNAILTSAAITAGARNLDIRDSHLKGGIESIKLFEQSENINIVDCILEAPTSISLENLERLNNDVTFIQGCKLLASTQVVNEVSYKVTDTGTLNFVNCSTITAITTNAKVIEFNTYLNANL